MPPKKRTKAAATPTSTPTRSNKRKAEEREPAKKGKTKEELKAEEDAKVADFFQNFKQKEDAKKAAAKKQPSEPSSPASEPSALSRRPNRSATSSPARKPAASPARRKAATKTTERMRRIEEEEEEEEVADEVEDEVEKARPPAKRRRVISPVKDVGKKEIPTDEELKAKARAWSEQFKTNGRSTAQEASPVASSVASAPPVRHTPKGTPNRMTNAPAPMQSTINTPVNVSSTAAMPVYSQSAQLSWTPSRRHTISGALTRGVAPASASQYVPAPPPRQIAQRNPAPFNSPVLTFNGLTASSSQHVTRSPPPVMPTVQELDVSAGMLSPKPRETMSTYNEHHPEYVLAEENTVEEPRRPKGLPFFKTETGIAVIAFFAVLVVSMLLAMVFDSSTQSDGWKSLFSALNGTTQSTLISCFEDFPVRNNLEIEEEVVVGGGPPSSCLKEDTHPIKPCPEGGHCSDGQLKHCFDPILQVSVDGTECVFTSEAQRQREGLRDLLTKYTVYHVCSASSSPNPYYVKGSEDPPLFDYRALIDVLQIPYHPKLITHVTKREKDSPVFLLVRNESDGSLSLGLHPSQAVDLPLDCFVKRALMSVVSTVLVPLRTWLKQLVVSIFNGLMGWTWTLSVALTSWIFSMFAARPLLSTTVSAIILFSGMLIYHVFQEHRLVLELEAEIIQVREQVYVELSRNPESIVGAKVIADRIVWKRYPRSRAQRERFGKYVFPHVVRDIAKDSRIRKTHSGSPPELYWKWVDPDPYRRASH